MELDNLTKPFRQAHLLAGLAALLCFAPVRAQAAVVLSTSFSSVASDNMAFTDGVTTTSYSSGVKDNSWTVTDTSTLDLKEVTSFTLGSYTWGSASDTVKKGQWALYMGDGAYTNGSVNSNQRINTGGDKNIQFNASGVGNSSQADPGDVAVFSFVFEVKPGASFNQLSATFDMGSGNTSGGWYSATAAQNGFFNIRILGLDNATDFSFYNTPQAAGAGGPYTATATDQTGSTLNPGTYLLQIRLSDKTQNQRYTIDDFSLSAVPEPAALALLTLGGVLMLPRSRRR